MSSIAIVGTGPAALMVAEVVSGQGHTVAMFEKRKGPGRKLLIAGSSGLNISNSLPLDEFAKHYSGPFSYWKDLLTEFSPTAWIEFIEKELNLETFEGTSGRYFVREMKASKLLRTWLDRLKARGVTVFTDEECVGFSCGVVGENREVMSGSADGAELGNGVERGINRGLDGAVKLELARGTDRGSAQNQVQLEFSSGQKLNFDVVCFCLGGGSYEPSENPLHWPNFFKTRGVKFTDFTPSNVGYQVEWSEAFLKEADGLPLKNITLTSSKGTRKGDVIITKYGLEGTPVYFMGAPETVHLDLKPDLTEAQILSKCRAVKENLSPLRRVKKTLALCPAALALLFHQTPKTVLADLNLLAHYLKTFPITMTGSQSLDEAISSAGGIAMSELNPDQMLKRYPNVFLAGEMLDWDAPTGGFLIQACVAQGRRAGKSILRSLQE